MNIFNRIWALLATYLRRSFRIYRYLIPGWGKIILGFVGIFLPLVTAIGHMANRFFRDHPGVLNMMQQEGYSLIDKIEFIFTNILGQKLADLPYYDFWGYCLNFEALSMASTIFTAAVTAGITVRLLWLVIRLIRGA